MHSVNTDYFCGCSSVVCVVGHTCEPYKMAKLIEMPFEAWTAELHCVRYPT